MKKERLKDIISEHLNVKAINIDDNSSFIHDLKADSLDLVELVMALEEAFNVEIDDDSAENIHKVSDLFSIIGID